MLRPIIMCINEALLREDSDRFSRDGALTDLDFWRLTSAMLGGIKGPVKRRVKHSSFHSESATLDCRPMTTWGVISASKIHVVILSSPILAVISGGKLFCRDFTVWMGWLLLQDIVTVKTIQNKGRLNMLCVNVCKPLPLQNSVYKIVVGIRETLFGNTETDRTLLIAKSIITVS